MTTPIFTSIDHLNGKDILILSPLKKHFPKIPRSPLDPWTFGEPLRLLNIVKIIPLRKVQIAWPIFPKIPFR